MDWTQVILSVLAGLTTAIPLVVKLVEYVQKAVREKNWTAMLEMVMKYMEAAEEKFGTGAERKEWVLAMVQAAADSINYDIDLTAIGEMIDRLCDMSRVVNSTAEGAGE